MGSGVDVDTIYSSINIKLSFFFVKEKYRVNFRIQDLSSSR
jgi:hypothetical protein